MAKIPKNPLKDLRAYRESLRENQSEFWGRFGVTQSGGSRYESGRRVPRPIGMLIHLFFTERINDLVLREALKKVSKD